MISLTLAIVLIEDSVTHHTGVVLCRNGQSSFALIQEYFHFLYNKWKYLQVNYKWELHVTYTTNLNSEDGIQFVRNDILQIKVKYKQ